MPVSNALSKFKNVANNYPGSPEGIQAVSTARLIYIDLGRVDEYARWVKGLDYVNVSDADLDNTTYESAEKQYLAGDTSKAIRLFNGYLNEFPNGFTKKMKVLSSTIPTAHSITWKEWKLKEKHRTDQKIFDDFIYSDSEENLYYPYPPGYYSNFNCDKITTIKVQKSLIARGYELKITGEFNQETKAALVQFQKDNGLPSCGNGHILLELLGIDK